MLVIPILIINGIEQLYNGPSGNIYRVATSLRNNHARRLKSVIYRFKLIIETIRYRRSDGLTNGQTYLNIVKLKLVY